MTGLHNIDSYILIGREPVKCNDNRRIGEFSNSGEKNLFKDRIDNVTVSTIFLVFDHNILSERPVLFETMVFEDDGDYKMTTRYSTYDDARIGHYSTIVELLVQRRENGEN